jgi:hypothetical protein
MSVCQLPVRNKDGNYRLCKVAPKLGKIYCEIHSRMANGERMVGRYNCQMSIKDRLSGKTRNCRRKISSKDSREGEKYCKIHSKKGERGDEIVILSGEKKIKMVLFYDRFVYSVSCAIRCMIGSFWYIMYKCKR